MTKIINEIETAVNEIMDGNVIALPTETVYGLAANALNQEAVLKIYDIKERPKFNPLIVHVYDIGEVQKYATEIPEEILKIMEEFSPGPITYVLKKKSVIPDIVSAGLDTVAVRIPSHEIFRTVLKETSLPISAPSANRFGRISPTSAEDVFKELSGRVRYIFDGGKSGVGIESTVIGYDDEGVKILRPGYITREDIEKLSVKVSEPAVDEEISSPGLLKFHYAPITPMYIINKGNIKDYESDETIGILNLCQFEDVKETALNLFSEIRKLDEGGYEYIVTSKVDDSGIGRAINDRIYKAATGFIVIVNNEVKFIEK